MMPYKNKQKQLEYEKNWRNNKKDCKSLKKEEEMIPLYMMELLMLKWTLNEMKEGREVTLGDHMKKEREIKERTQFDNSLDWVKRVLG